MKRPLRMLIVDDEAPICTFIKSICSRNFDCEEITLAQDGVEALHFLSQSQYDIVISDWNMPNKKGDDLLFEIRHSGNHRHVPFIMLTGRSDKDSVMTAIDKEVSDYIIKPFDIKVLTEKIRKLINIAKLREFILEIITENSRDGCKQHTSEDLDTINDIVRRFKIGKINLPVLPEVSFKIMELMNSRYMTIDELSYIIKTDPSITSKLIAFSNTAAHGKKNAHTTLEQAIQYLGIEKTKTHVFMISNQGLFTSQDPLFERIIRQLDEHCRAAGECARLTARKLKLANPDAFFTMGLLHDTGKLVLIELLAEISKDHVQLGQAWIQAILDSLHQDFGATLLTEWNFPDEFRNICLYHDDLSKADMITKELLVVNFSDQLVRHLGFDLNTGEQVDLPDIESSKLLNVGREMIDEVMHEVSEFIDRTRKHVSSPP